MTFSERGCLLHFADIGNYKFLFGIELNFKDEITRKLRNYSLRADPLNLVYSYIHTICDTWAGCTAGYEITASCQTEYVAQVLN